MSYEKIFDDAAKVEMSPGWSIVKFRKTHPTLLRAIMRAMASVDARRPARPAPAQEAAVPPLLAGLYHNACPNCGTLHWTKHGMIAECGDCYKQAALERQKEEKDGRR